MGAFCAGLLTNAFDIHLGYTFSASLIDFGVGYFNQKNSMYLWLIVGPIIGLLYFTTFYWLIKLFDFKTPGREVESTESQSFSSSTDKARAVLVALGGKENITHLDACITRLRLELNNVDIVDREALKSMGSSGVMVSGHNMQVIFGPESDSLKEEIKIAMKENIKALTMKSPLIGEVINISDVPDATFADKLLGDGVAIRPTEGVLYSPVDGEVAQLFHTNHAIGIKTKTGSEVLLHVGIDTVKMQGEGFKAFIKVGDSVKAGEKLIEFDLNLIKEKAKSDITPFVITNMHDVASVEVLASGQINQNQDLMTVTMQ